MRFQMNEFSSIRYNLTLLSEDVKVLIRSTINIYRPLMLTKNVISKYSEIQNGSVLSEFRDSIKEELSLYFRYSCVSITSFLGNASKKDVFNLDVLFTIINNYSKAGKLEEIKEKKKFDYELEALTKDYKKRKKEYRDSINICTGLRNNRIAHYLASEDITNPIPEPTYFQIRELTIFIADIVHKLNRLFENNSIYIGNLDDEIFKEIEKEIFIETVEKFGPLIAISNVGKNDAE